MIAILVASALAGDLPLVSLAQPAPVHDEADVFSAVQFDTGWWPNKGDLVAVRFHVTPNGGVFTDIDADSELAWPVRTMEHRLVALPDTGSFRAEATIDIEAEVSIDLFGLYQGTVDLWAEQIAFDEEQLFDGLLLIGGPGREVSIVADDDGAAPVEYTYSVVPGLSLVSSIQLYPELEATMTGREVQTTAGYEQLGQNEELEWEPFLLPTAATPEMPLDIVWSGDLDAALNLVIEPVVELDTILGDFELLSIPIDIELVSVQEVRDAEVQSVLHPLPALGELIEQHGFGEVEVGQERSLALDVPNLGALLLEGHAVIEGDAAFSVFPEELVARPADEDGVVVTFAPEAEGLSEAELVITSNAPEAPEVRIPLTGMGWVEPPPATTPTTPTTGGTTPTSTSTTGADTAPDGVSSEDIKGARGCGCATSGPTPWGGLVLLGLVALRRRRAA